MKLYVTILFGVLLTTLFHNAIAIVDSDVIQLKILFERARETYINDRVDPETIADVDTAVQICLGAQQSPIRVTVRTVLRELLTLCHQKESPKYIIIPDYPRTTTPTTTPAPSTRGWAQVGIEDLINRLESRLHRIRRKLGLSRTGQIPKPVPGLCIIAQLLESFLLH
ncbi:uncharacterized protein DMAD_10457 [Drosophila madeirensis]|uniref:Uncharacterized protein n=1 Tax=Drosophila madeirensis TaxID=30013 RepID=A0AAU9F9M1_DROMD